MTTCSGEQLRGPVMWLRSHHMKTLVSFYSDANGYGPKWKRWRCSLPSPLTACRTSESELLTAPAEGRAPDQRRVQVQLSGALRLPGGPQGVKNENIIIQWRGVYLYSLTAPGLSPFNVSLVPFEIRFSFKSVILTFFHLVFHFFMFFCKTFYVPPQEHLIISVLDY